MWSSKANQRSCPQSFITRFISQSPFVCEYGCLFFIRKWLTFAVSVTCLADALVFILRALSAPRTAAVAVSVLYPSPSSVKWVSRFTVVMLSAVSRVVPKAKPIAPICDYTHYLPCLSWIESDASTLLSLCRVLRRRSVVVPGVLLATEGHHRRRDVELQAIPLPGSSHPSSWSNLGSYRAG